MSFWEKIFGTGASPLLQASFEEVGKMVEQSGKMFDVALEGLLDNAPLSDDLNSMDDIVDQSERDVLRRVVEHLAVDPGHDPVATLTVATMVHDAERLGDYCRGLSEVVDLAKSPRQGPFADRLRRLSGLLRPLFEETLRVLRDDDPEGAKRIMAQCSELKKEYIDLTSQVADSALSADMAVVYASSARMMRRIGAHLSNIASAIGLPYDQIRRSDEGA